MTEPDNGAPRTIERERVVAAVERAASGFPLVLFDAPGGFGKSTAVAQFVARRGAPVALLSLDARHATLAGFANALLAVLAPGPSDVVPTSADADDALARVVAAASAAGRTIVLDRFGGAPDPRVAALVVRAIDATRGRASWIVATRDAGELPVSRWCADETIDHPIDEADLRFDADEFRRFAGAAGAVFDDGDVTELTALTAGWPAAVAAAVAAGRDAHGDRERAFRTARAAMRGLLAKGVFAVLGADERRFLVRTCLFDELASDTLGALGGDAGAMLERVRAATSLVGHGDDGGFRYHPVMRDVLTAALHAEGEAAYERVLAATAATLAATGRHAQAARLRVASGTPAQILATLRAQGQALVDRGEFAVVREALDGLAERTRETDAAALALAVQAGGHGDASNLERRCAAVAAACGSPDDRARLAIGLGTYLGRVDRGAEASALLSSLDAAAIDEPALRARVLAERARFAARTPAGIADATTTIEAALALIDREPDALLLAVVYRRAADVYAAARRFEEANRYATAAADAARAADAPRLELRALATSFRIATELGPPASAHALLRTICERAGRGNDLEMLLYGLCAASDAAAASGDAAWLDELDAALRAARGAAGETFVEELGLPFRDGLARSRALRLAWRGEFALALDLLDGTDSTACAAAAAAEAALYAAAAGLHERASDARAVARRGVAAPSGPLSPAGIAARLMLALAALVSDDPGSFERDTASLEGMADRMPLSAILFVRAVRAAGDFALNRISRIQFANATAAMRERGLGGYAAVVEALPIRASAAVAGTSLTASEIRILELLCEGATSREIAARLGRSVLTVDSHVKSIVKKLRCSGGRREAVELARAGRIAGLPARFAFAIG